MNDRLPNHSTDVTVFRDQPSNSLSEEFFDLPAQQQAAEDEDQMDWGRYFAALRRHKWIVLLIFMAGLGSSAVLWRTYEPEYVAQGALWVQTDRSGGGGPISGGELLTSYAWIDLLRSWSVLDSVVSVEGLYLTHDRPADSVLFSGFTVGDIYEPGLYKLKVGETGSVFLTTRSDSVLDEVPAGRPLGLRQGFAWTPTPDQLAPGLEIPFSVVTPRDAAAELSGDLLTTMDQLGSFIRVELAGKDRVKIASVVNRVMERTVDLAADLKRGQLDERTRILQDQLVRTELELNQAEANLEGFRVETIMLPTDRANPVVAGLQRTNDPVFSRFFQLRTEVETIGRDYDNLSRALAIVPDSGVRIEVFEMIAAVRSSSQLSAALSELGEARANLRRLRLRYTDEHPPVQDLLTQIDILENQTIPSLGQLVLQGLAEQQREAQSRVASASEELSEIPPRTIEEARLERRVEISENMYTEIRGRYEEASLAAASSIPEVRILDYASVPQLPNADQRIRLILMLLVGSLGAGVAAAILLDRVDPRIRYPTDVTSDLGLGILGTIPHIRSKAGKSPANLTQVLEAFRELRLNVSYAYGAAGPVILTVSSPAQSEGKSFISSNLAIAFAEFGRRTLLIDGDTRRGDMHSVLNVERRPGLTDVLSEEASLKDAIQQSDYPNLDVITSGTRVTNSPELLGSPIMQNLLAEVRSRYDVVIVDSPPMGAGSDAFILAALTGNLALVARNGGTNKDFMQQKMAPLSRLPIRVLGAILNDVPGDGAYRYYSNYLTGYDAASEDPNATQRQLAQGSASK